MIATEYNPSWRCECRALLMAYWSDFEHTKMHLECPRSDCKHRGKRFAIPTIELKELPAEPVQPGQVYDLGGVQW